MAEKHIKLKYNPTGNIFTLPETEAKRIYLEDKGFNYKVVEGKIEIEEKTIEETSVYNQIVQDSETEKTEETTEGETNGRKTLAEYTVPELKAKLDVLNIKYAKNAKKDELLALFKDSETCF